MSIAATDVSVTLGATGAGATVSGGTGELLATSAGIAGSVSGLITVALPTSVTLSGTIGLAINTTTSAVNQTFAVDGQTLTLALPGGPYLELSGTGVTISAFGQTITGNVAIQQVTSTAQSPSTSVVEIGVSERGDVDRRRDADRLTDGRHRGPRHRAGRPRRPSPER